MTFIKAAQRLAHRPIMFRLNIIFDGLQVFDQQFFASGKQDFARFKKRHSTSVQGLIGNIVFPVLFNNLWCFKLYLFPKYSSPSSGAAANL
jgi:hypothetical protein